MGSIAKLGIVSGKLVPISDVPGHRAPAPLTEFSRACLSRFGFARIADRIADGLSLGVRDVEMLLSKASLPVLMKLVEIRHGADECVEPLPLVVLPLSTWVSRYCPTQILELSQGLLRSIGHKQLRVVIDEIDYSKLDGELFAVLREISTCRPGVTLVGPSVDDVVSWVVSAASRGDDRELGKFEKLLHRLREAGVGRLQPSSVVDVLKTVREAGFPASLVTNVTEFTSALDLSKELLRVNDIAKQQPIDVWVPGYSAGAVSASSRSSMDFRLLRVLAVGTLCMDAVPYRRASTRFFSVNAIQFSRFCGANDFGFGAVNEITAQAMHLEKLERLREAIGSEVSAEFPVKTVTEPCLFPEA